MITIRQLDVATQELQDLLSEFNDELEDWMQTTGDNNRYPDFRMPPNQKADSMRQLKTAYEKVKAIKQGFYDNIWRTG